MNELIHAPTRLRIMSALVELGPDSEITFNRLQDLLDMTPGNLSAHIKKLEAADYLVVSKGFTPRGVTQTHVAITDHGIEAFNAYIEQLRQVIGSPLSK